MHTSEAVLLWIRAHLVLPAKMPLMLIKKKKILPPYQSQLTRFKFPHQRTHSFRFISCSVEIFQTNASAKRPALP